MSSTVDAFPETFTNPENAPDERYTLTETDLWCRKKAGVQDWDLDVAACEESHLALTWYGHGSYGFINGLLRPWSGRVWCNPPWSNIEPWVEKAWREILHCQVIAMLLPANRTEQPWFQTFVEPFREGRKPALIEGLTTHFLPGRTKFGHPGNPNAVGVGSPPFGSMLLVWTRAPRPPPTSAPSSGENRWP